MLESVLTAAAPPINGGSHPRSVGDLQYPPDPPLCGAGPLTFVLTFVPSNLTFWCEQVANGISSQLEAQSPFSPTPSGAFPLPNKSSPADKDLSLSLIRFSALQA